jgi:hypothetical protein
MFQVFRGTQVDPQPAAFPTITATTETVLIPTLFTPIPALGMRASQVWKLTVGGTCTTGASGTMVITPRYGTVIGGVSLTASAAQTVVPSITLAPFIYEAWLIFRSLGQAGTNSSVVCTGKWLQLGAIATAASQTSVTHTSTASVSVDTTVAAALWIGVTFSVAPSIIPLWHLWEPVN